MVAKRGMQPRHGPGSGRQGDPPPVVRLHAGGRRAEWADRVVKSRPFHEEKSGDEKYPATRGTGPGYDHPETGFIVGKKTVELGRDSKTCPVREKRGKEKKHTFPRSCSCRKGKGE